jgi:two-component system cell cycle response regulator
MAARILVIEDNAANLELMVYLLAASGYTMLASQDGEEGFQLACEVVPDLILCDLQMPGLDGYEVAQRAGRAAGLRDIPLVAVTAFAMVGDREKALAAGFHGYLAKPIDPDTFVQQVEAFLQPACVAHRRGI